MGWTIFSCSVIFWTTNYFNREIYIVRNEVKSQKLGKSSFAYAWVLDETGEERSRWVLICSDLCKSCIIEKNTIIETSLSKPNTSQVNGCSVSILLWYVRHEVYGQCFVNSEYATWVTSMRHVIFIHYAYTVVSTEFNCKLTVYLRNSEASEFDGKPIKVQFFK